jgi:ribonuclease BN (tRNA processing enzyme)
MKKEEYIRFVSTGGIFDCKMGNSSMIININQDNILVDCGYTVYSALVKNSLIEKIDYILITHLHGDHIGSIHPLILHLVNKCKKKVRIIYPTNSFLKQLIDYLQFFLIDVNKYVEFININELYNIGYVDTTNFHVAGMQSFAYYFIYSDSLIYVSGDLGKVEITENFLNSISLSNITVFHETSFIKGDAHVYYKDLMRLSERFDVYAYHCNHLLAPDDCKLKFVAQYKKLCI